MRPTAGWPKGWRAGWPGSTTTAEDKRQARDALLGLLARETDSWVAERLAGGLAQLDPTAEDKRQARDALLGLLARETDQLAWPHGWRARWPSSRRRRRTSARPATRCSGCWPVRPTTGRPQGWRAGWPSSTRRRRTSARPATRCSGCWPARPTAVAEGLAGGLAQLDPTAEDKRQARDALLGLLARETDSGWAAGLADGLGQLDPTVHDLRTWRAWAVRPTAELLAAVRRNSALTNWLAALPSLTSVDRPEFLGGHDLWEIWDS